jgi:hypothetical protein
MQQDTQDTTARTASPRFSTADFDCELPPGARAELLKPKRPRILGHPSHAPDRRSAIVLAVLVLLLLAGVVVALIQHQATMVTPAVQPPTQSPEPPEHVVEQPILPPRAQLVRMPAPPESVPGVWLTGPAARAEPVAPVTVRRAEFMHPARHPVPAPPVSTPPQPEQAVYREWAGNGWVLADAQCVPLRGTFIADPAPRAELVSTAVCQP